MKKIKVVALIGKAGAGKDFYLRQVCDKAKVHEIISCTTRPVRDGELEGVNYHYLSDEQFLSDKYIESCVFRGWRYGTRLKDLDPDAINVGVFNLAGIEQLLNNDDIDLTIFNITASDKTRILRQLKREDEPDVDEIMRRFNADTIDFYPQRLARIQEQLQDNYYWVNNDSADKKGTLVNVNYIINTIKAELK